MKKHTDRQHVRPIKQIGLGEKKFRKIIETRKQVDRTKIVHPLVVIRDLRKGVVTSLGRYLTKHRGIPDRAVALELKKLISGSRERTPYRLIVVEHPDTPKDKGGRPPTKRRAPTEAELEVVRAFEQALKLTGSVESAVSAVRAKRKISASGIHAYRKKVAEYERTLSEEADPSAQDDGNLLKW
jgi:hypothetical protein